jgi:DNA repair photolyase
VDSSKPIRGRAARSNRDARYLSTTRESYDDGWTGDDEYPLPRRTTVTEEHPKSIISRNKSSDVPFEQSINPYRGCEHGCVYCYARPLLLKNELGKKNYQCSVICLGGNTDAYQPIERQNRITRTIMEVLAECRHPVTIVSKSSLVERDIDLLEPMAAIGLAQVFVSITSLDRELSRRMEPRAAAPQRRLKTIGALANAGIPTGVMFAPVITALNDMYLEDVLEAATDAGAKYAGYVMLRLPGEVNGLFKEWLAQHYPLRADRVMNRVRDTRNGAENDVKFGRRFKGTGAIAELLGQRFRRSCRTNGLNQIPHIFNTKAFRSPTTWSQMSLF